MYTTRFLAIVGLAFVFWFGCGPRDALYNRKFQDYRVRIVPTAEVYPDGREVPMLSVSCYQPPQLMFEARMFQHRRDAVFDFRDVTTDNLVCVFDTGATGFLLILDLANDEWFLSNSETGQDVIEHWRLRYQMLRKEFPEIPRNKLFE